MQDTTASTHATAATAWDIKATIQGAAVAKQDLQPTCGMLKHITLIITLLGEVKGKVKEKYEDEDKEIINKKQEIKSNK